MTLGPISDQMFSLRMNLLLNALLGGLDELARGRGLEKFRVSHKRNARGELVIALIVSPEESALRPDKIPLEGHAPRTRSER